MLLLDGANRILERASAADRFDDRDARNVIQQIADVRASMLTSEDEFTIVWSNDPSLNVFYRKIGGDRAVAVLFRARSEMGAVRSALTDAINAETGGQPH